MVWVGSDQHLQRQWVKQLRSCYSPNCAILKLYSLTEVWFRRESIQGEANIYSLSIHEVIQADYISTFKKTNSHASNLKQMLVEQAEMYTLPAVMELLFILGSLRKMDVKEVIKTPVLMIVLETEHALALTSDLGNVLLFCYWVSSIWKVFKEENLILYFVYRI